MSSRMKEIERRKLPHSELIRGPRTMNLRKIALVVMCAATAGLLWSSMGRSLAAEETDASDTETMTHNSQQIAMSLLAVYLPVESQVDAPKAAEKVIARHSKKFKVLNAWPKPGEVDLPFVVVAETNTAEYAPPSTDSLKYFGRGLDEKQAEQLQLSKRALTLSFVYPRVAAWPTMQEAYAMLDKVASETEGFIWDEHTRLVYSPEHGARNSSTRQREFRALPTTSLFTLTEMGSTSERSPWAWLSSACPTSS